MSDEIKLRDRVGELEKSVESLKKDVLALTKGLKKAADEIEDSWGDEIVPEGTEISGVKF